MAAPHMTAEHLGAEYFQDPYSVHARLREQRPVTPVIMPGGMSAWLVTGYAEARAALADPRLRKNMPGWRPEPTRSSPPSKCTCSTAIRRTTSGCAGW